MELDMSSKSVQWMLWAIVMSVFTGLTLTGRWLDLALTMTIVGVLWYGIVPGARSRRQ
jgi:hypothetical protein